jgi:hypothetical protein
MSQLLSETHPAARIDALMAKIAEVYRSLPKRPELALHFREALSRHALPGGYVVKGASARLFAEGMGQYNRGETQC